MSVKDELAETMRDALEGLTAMIHEQLKDVQLQPGQTLVDFLVDGQARLIVHNVFLSASIANLIKNEAQFTREQLIEQFKSVQRSLQGTSR